jgi:hypothetical protein
MGAGFLVEIGENDQDVPVRAKIIFVRDRRSKPKLGKNLPFQTNFFRTWIDGYGLKK